MEKYVAQYCWFTVPTWQNEALLVASSYVHSRDAPVAADLGPGWIVQRQAYERDRGGNGEGANEAHEEANETRETDEDLKKRGHHDRALQLWTGTQ